MKVDKMQKLALKAIKEAIEDVHRKKQMKDTEIYEYGTYRLGLTGSEVLDWIEMVAGKKQSKKVFSRFMKWMYGQTTALVDGKCLYYRHDVQRGLDFILHKKTTYFD